MIDSGDQFSKMIPRTVMPLPTAPEHEGVKAGAAAATMSPQGQSLDLYEGV